MARRRRLQLPGFYRHVMSRGNGRDTIFLDDRDYRTFEQILAEVIEEYEIDCLDYCSMPNHYHATFRPSQGNISLAMQELDGEYAKYWNRRHHHVGHVFQGRFKDQIVQQEGYLLSLGRYIARNPLRAGLVGRPEDWPWSSYAATIGLRQEQTFINSQLLLGQYGDGSIIEVRQRFVEFVNGEAEGECSEERIRSKERILGNAAFKKAVRKEFRAAAAPPPPAAEIVDDGSIDASFAEASLTL